eukprot:Awhi_evm1s15188
MFQHNNSIDSMFALLMAILEDKLSIVEKLCPYQAYDDLNTALSLSLTLKRRKISSYLQSRGCEELPSDPLIYGCETGNLAIVRFTVGLYQLDSFSEKLTQQLSREAMTISTQLRHVDIIEYLMENIPGSDTSTASFVCARRGDLSLVKFFLEKAPRGSIDATCDLEIACQFGHLEVVKYLLPHCSPGSSVLAYSEASKYNQQHILDFLKEEQFSIKSFFRRSLSATPITKEVDEIVPALDWSEDDNRVVFHYESFNERQNKQKVEKRPSLIEQLHSFIY